MNPCIYSALRSQLCKGSLQAAIRSSRPPRSFSRQWLPIHTTRHASTKSPTYTSEAYPHIHRDPRFSTLTQDHTNHFKSLLDPTPTSLISNLQDENAEDIDPYNTDWMRKYRGHTSLVLRPSTTEQISQILSYCNAQNLAVVPQGGNTGLVGGSVPVFDEIVISLGRMNNIRSFDEVSGILVADAGVILEVADNYLAERKHLFPLDLGAKGSCQLGGTVATNAGGLRLLRYGSMHGNILGIEAVLPDGTIINNLSTLRKNNTGYDLKQLFIGGEGTLGIITAISILCPQRLPAANVAALGVSSFAKLQQTFVEAKSKLSEIISAFELMDSASQRVLKTAKDTALPLESEYPFYCLIETSGSNAEHDQEKLEAFLEHVMEKEIVADGIVAQDATQAKSLWGCREGITEALNHWGGVYKYDLSIPLPKMYELVEVTREKLTKEGLLGNDPEKHPVVDVVAFGHMGDQNLHLNIPTRKFDKRVEQSLEPFVFRWVAEQNGSISAEHGLGLAKKPFIQYSQNETMIHLMKQIKQLYDAKLTKSSSIMQKGIMNPYKYV